MAGDPILRDADLADLGDDALLTVVAELERRRPGAPVASTGVRPDRRPWTYRDIWRLEAARTEATRRGLTLPEGPA
jgi:hypothetical protein